MVAGLDADRAQRSRARSRRRARCTGRAAGAPALAARAAQASAKGDHEWWKEGGVTREKLDILRQADAIYLEEIRQADDSSNHRVSMIPTDTNACVTLTSGTPSGVV